MKKFLKIMAWLTGALVVVLIAIVFAGSQLAERKRERTVEVSAAAVPYVSNDASLKQGKYLYETRGCAECHGVDGRGKVVVDAPNGLYIRAPNISPGTGSVVNAYREIDWVKAIRHGVKPSGQPALIMPSEDYNRLTDADLAAMVAYVRSLPPVAGEPAQIRMPLLIKVLYAFGVIPDAAERIDHRAPPSKPIPVAVNAHYGGYVAAMCIGCHGEHYSGGKIPGGPPDWPPAANLTPGPGSAMAGYDSAAKFSAMMRTGKRPDGAAVSTVMPFDSLKKLNDADLEAMHAFLKTLPPRPAGQR